ncbi:VOC family protein [Gordonia sp. VNK1]|uniref:VOC family protein n=1 Tax=Gordonia oleivorans TaxID=3156618 RepID=UPI0032B5374A
MSTTPELLGFHHLGITVRDVDASEAWYGQTLGLVRAFVEKHDNDTGYAVVMTRPGTTFFLGLDHHHEADRQFFDARRTGLDHLALAASSGDEVRSWVAHFDELGVEHGPLHETDDPMPLVMVQLHDPDGIPIEIIWTGM